MKILSLSEAKIKLSQLVEQVNTMDEEIVITKNGRPSAVLISPDEYEGWKETIKIKSDPDLMKEIKQGLLALKKKSKLYTLDDKTLRGLHPELKRKVKFALKNILSDPHSGKSLKIDLKGLHSYKAGRFRIIYRIASRRIVEIVAIGPRRKIYE